MKVYIVLANWCEEDGNCACGCDVYTTKEKAKAKLKEWVDVKERDYAKEHGWTIYEDTDLCFDAGLNGKYCMNNVCISVEEKELIE